MVKVAQVQQPVHSGTGSTLQYATAIEAAGGGGSGDSTMVDPCPLNQLACQMPGEPGGSGGGAARSNSRAGGAGNTPGQGTAGPARKCCKWYCY